VPLVDEITIFVHAGLRIFRIGHVEQDIVPRVAGEVAHRQVRVFAHLCTARDLRVIDEIQLTRHELLGLDRLVGHIAVNITVRQHSTFGPGIDPAPGNRLAGVEMPRSNGPYTTDGSVSNSLSTSVVKSKSSWPV